MSKSMLNFALDYAKNGFKVIPVHYPVKNGCSCGNTKCNSMGKHPMIKNWNVDATTDPEKIKQWWNKSPNANIGIITGLASNLIVIDVDIKNGATKHLTKLRKNYPVLNQTSIVKTGGGGYHFYLRTYDSNLKNSASKLDQNVDIRANGGFIVAPPSLHHSGKRYEWSPGLEMIKDMPSQLLTDLKKKRTSTKKGAVIKEGSRNDHLFSIAGKLRNQGAEYEEILEQIIVINELECNPPLEHNELESICESIMKYDPDNADSEIDEKLIGTDIYNAKLLYELNKSKILFDIERSIYLIYNGKYWVEDHNNHRIEALAGELQNHFRNQAKSESNRDTRKRLISSARSCSNIARIRSISSILHIAVPEIRISPNSLNPNGDLLNLSNGTLKLSTKQLQPHNPNDRITTLLNFKYDENAKCPTWNRFLNTMFDGDEDLIQFIQQALGYTLTTDQSQQCFFFLYGQGKNGKSTFLEVLQALLGEYSIKAGFSSIMKKKYGDGIPNDIARFAGKRLIVFSEIPQGSQLDEAKVKDLTGGDTITARFLRQNYFDFLPTHTIWMYGNHRPSIVGTDEGIWRRMMLIECAHTVSKQELDPDLKEKLLKELSGILNWCIAGYKNFLDNGKKLTEPESVRKARISYRSESDITSHFINDVCKVSANETVKFGDLYQEYRLWCESLNRPPQSNRELSTYLRTNGFKERNSGGFLYFNGIGLTESLRSGSSSSRSS